MTAVASVTQLLNVLSPVAALTSLYPLNMEQSGHVRMLPMSANYISYLLQTSPCSWSKTGSGGVTRLKVEVLWLVHTADMDTTRQFCLVRVGGVNTIGVVAKLSYFVCSCVHTTSTDKTKQVVWTQLQTRQDSFVSSMSAVWTSYYCLHCNKPKLTLLSLTSLDCLCRENSEFWDKGQPSENCPYL